MAFEHISDLERNEQYMSTITHGLGALLVIIGFHFIIYRAFEIGDPTVTLGAVIFMVSLLMVYLSSTLYHHFYFTSSQNLLRTIDHICIYFLIAGTNTPFIFLYHQNNYGMALMSIFWGLVVLGTLYKWFFIGKNEAFSLFVYVFMGWMGLLTLYPIFGQVSELVYYLILAGGIFYSLGTYFYTKEDLPYHHSIWHLFVMAGSISHYFAVYYTL